MTKIFVYMIFLWSIATTAIGLWGAFIDLPTFEAIPMLAGSKIVTLVLPLFVSTLIVIALASLYHKAGFYFSRAKYGLACLMISGGLAFTSFSGLFASGTNNLLMNSQLLKEIKTKESNSDLDHSINTVYYKIRDARDGVVSTADLSERKAEKENRHGGTCEGNPSKAGPGPRKTLREDIAIDLSKVAEEMKALMGNAVELRTRLAVADTSEKKQKLYIDAVALLDDERIAHSKSELSKLILGFNNGFPNPLDPKEQLFCGDSEMLASLIAARTVISEKFVLPPPPSGSDNPVLTDSIRNTIRVVGQLFQDLLFTRPANAAEIEERVVNTTIPTLVLSGIVELVCLTWAFGGGMSSDRFRNTPNTLLGKDDYDEDMDPAELNLLRDVFSTLELLTIKIVEPAAKPKFSFMSQKYKHITLFIVPQNSEAHQKQAALFVRKAGLCEVESARVFDVGDMLMNEADAEKFTEITGTSKVRIFYWNKRAEKLVGKISKILGMRGSALFS